MVDIYEIYSVIEYDKLSKVEIEELLINSASILYRDSTDYQLISILTYIKDNNVTDEIINNIIAYFDFGLNEKRSYFNKYNYKLIKVRILTFEIIMKYKGNDVLLQMILENLFMENYTLLLYMAIRDNNEYISNILLKTLREYRKPKYSFNKGIINIHGAEVPKHKIPYNIVSNVLKLDSIYTNYDSNNVIEKIREIIISDSMFNFNSSTYCTLYDRLRYRENIITFEKYFDFKFKILDFGSLYIKNEYMNNHDVRDEFIKRINDCDNKEQIINKLFDKFNQSYRKIKLLYKSLLEFDLISSTTINTIFKEFNMYSDFYRDKKIQNEFIELGLEYNTILKHNKNQTGFRNMGTSGYSTGIGEDVEQFMDRFVARRRKMILKKIKGV